MPTRRPIRRLAPGLALAAVLAAAPAGAVRAPEPGALLPDLDVRLSRNARYQAVVALQHGVKQADLVAGPVADPGPLRRAALERVARGADAGAVEVRWDEVTGSPRLLFSRQGFLTGPDRRSPELVARDFVVAHRDLFLLDANEAAGLRLERVVPTSPGGGVVRFEQDVDGIDVLHGHLAVSVTPDGRILHVMGGSVTGAGELRSRIPRSDPSQALTVLAALAGVELAQPVAPLRAGEDGATFAAKQLRGPVTVRRTVIPTVGGPRLGWTADLFVAGSSAGYELTVDDATLQPVRRATRTWYLDTRGRVYANSPSESPYELERFPDGTDFRRDQSPFGWSGEAAAPRATAGNNVYVQDDIAGDDEATPGVQGFASGPAPYWAFDSPFTTGGPADQPASLTALFRSVNWAHDRYYDLGFDEPSGNFQGDNAGRGGLGGDAVLADDMDGSGTDNANFATLPDGYPGRMQMFLWGGAGSEKSSSFEAGVVIHELGHGVSTRLVGGPEDASCLLGFQSGSMGEAWSDYFAGSFLEDVRIAEWLSGNPDGIRMFALDENPPSGKDYRDFCTYASDIPPQICEVHDNGEMWSGFLWLVRQRYVAAFGPAEGVRRADQLVMDALKYTICQPSMLDARDALILADRLETGGQMECAIKEIAASRWMGSDASSTGGTDTQPQAGNRPWPECVDRGILRFDREGLDTTGAAASYGCDDVARIVLTDGNYVAAPDTVTVVVLRAAVEVDRELVSPAPGPEPGVFIAALPTSTAPGTPLDGTLQVQAGDEIAASYVDLAPGGSVVTARADVSCTPKLRVVRHRVLNGTCDTDEVVGYPELPGFVDAGETADIEVELANVVPYEVEGLLRITCDDPNLTLLPAGLVPVRFPAALGTSPASITLRLKAVAAPGVTAGEIANVTFELQGPNLVPGPAATLRLEMNLDYEVDRGLTYSFDMEGETAPAGPGWTRGELVAGGTNQWTVVTCRNTTPVGTKAFRNGNASCSGRYSDAQGDPYLRSPQLDFFTPDTRAARVTEAQWQNDVNLGVIGFPPTIPNALDADAVVVALTNDPSALDASDPIGIATTALAFYIKIDVPGFFTQDSNTSGWELDQRTVQPGQLSDVDYSQPAYLVWYFLPDVTPTQPPLDAQGNGYYLDDVLLTYERVRVAPQALACTPAVAVLSSSYVSDPALGAACAGATVTVDASRSESALCGPPAILEYRFESAGVTVACFEPDGVTPRIQDVDGWGTTPTCTEAVTADRTWAVEVRCQADPSRTDTSSASVRIVDGLPLIAGSDRAFCAGSGRTIDLDASASSLVGCPGVPEFAFSDASGPLDCDGDTVPDGFDPSSTCTVGPSDVPVDVTVELRCSTLPGCVLTDTMTIPAVAITPSAAEGSTAPGGFYCSGSSVTLDASGSVVTGCAGGEVQYRWTSGLGFDSGWISSPTLDVPVTADAGYGVEVRCSLSPSCVSAPAGPVSVQVRTGAFTLGQSTQAGDCAGDLFRLRGGVQDPPGVRCAGSVEYRYLQQLPGPPVSLVAIPCFDDQAATIPRTEDVDGWGATPDCWTPHVAGGADFVAEYRCGDDPACTLETALPRFIAPRTGVPAGTSPGSLVVRKSASGCVPGSDVRLSWADTDYAPTTFLVFRSDDPFIDTTTERVGAPDDILYVDAGAACDGGGIPYAGAVVYFYVHSGRNTCTNEPYP